MDPVAEIALAFIVFLSLPLPLFASAGLTRDDRPIAAHHRC